MPNLQQNIEHSSNIYIMDKQGHQEAAIPYNLPSNHILNVVKQVLKKSAK